MRHFLTNPGFELGDTGWTKGSNWTIGTDAASRTGAWRARFDGSSTSPLDNGYTASVRPGQKLNISGWFNGAAATGGSAKVVLRWGDKSGALINGTVGTVIASGSGYQQSIITDAVAPARTKQVTFRAQIDSPNGSVWYFDDMDASGDIIETIPTSAGLSTYRIVRGDTVAAFEPLIGDDKFTEFNAGLSDKWAGVYNFLPTERGGNLNELLAFLQRIGKTERFFAYDPDRQTPVNGVVNGMTVDGSVSPGATKIPVTGGPTSTTALVAGDYIEVGAQYFQLQRDLVIGPEDTGEAIVWPSVRATLADGEDIITDNPKMVARVTSDLEWSRTGGALTALSISFQEF